ncbi:MAG: hypothetical protein G01um101420_587 [Parcubacteria group bacterium Gr01-1014_20]|nr:MAG: hypothetical protein G01um101420_587 [Parcubacteria group bacterium Gr01-1014_20]
MEKNTKKGFLLLSLLSILAIFAGYWFVNKSAAFTGPPSGVSPGYGGGALQTLNGNFSIGGALPVSSTKLLISGSGNLLRIEQSPSTPFLRVENGIVVVGNYTPSGSEKLQADGIRATTSTFDEVRVKRMYVYGLLQASGTAVDISGFTNIVAQNINGTVPADSITSGAFNAGSAGSFAFPASLGVGTSSYAGLPSTLSVYGSSYFSGDVGVGMNIPTTGEGRLNIAANAGGVNSWILNYWNKAIRVEGNGAIEFGGGTGQTLYGIGVRGGNLYIFNTDSEVGGTAKYNLVIASGSVAMGNVDLTTVPQGVLDLIPTAAGTSDTLIVGFAPGKSSIRAWTGDLVLNSTGSGKIYLNNYHAGDVILTTSTANVGIGTSSPQAKLDVVGTIKATGFQLATSTTAGYVLTTIDALGNANWQAPNLGDGSTNYVAKWVSATSLGTSTIYDSGSAVGINTATSSYTLRVAGTARIGSHTHLGYGGASGIFLGNANDDKIYFNGLLAANLTFANTGGTFTLSTADGAVCAPSCPPASLIIKAGNASAGQAGGNLYFRAGADNDSASGNITLETLSGSGTGGDIIFKTSSTERMRVIRTGNVGINNSAPSYRLHVTSSTSGAIVAGFQNSNGTCTINPTAGSANCTSDLRLKKNVSGIDNALSVISSIRGVTFEWKNQTDSVRHYGFIAQELEKVVPEAVSTDVDGYKSVGKDSLIPILVQAVQEQQKIIDELKSEAARLKNELKACIKE